MKMIYLTNDLYLWLFFHFFIMLRCMLAVVGEGESLRDIYRSVNEVGVLSYQKA